MRFLRFFTPLRAYQDLRQYLSQRRPHELVFLTLAVGLTYLIIFFMIHDSKIVREYKPTLIYVQQWPKSRTDVEIIAQQKIDGPKQTAREEAEKRQAADTQAQFKKLDDGLKKWGI